MSVVDQAYHTQENFFGNAKKQLTRSSTKKSRKASKSPSLQNILASSVGFKKIEPFKTKSIFDQKVSKFLHHSG